MKGGETLAQGMQVKSLDDLLASKKQGAPGLEEAEKHRTPEDAPPEAWGFPLGEWIHTSLKKKKNKDSGNSFAEIPEVRARVEAALRRAERALARPLLLATADRAETAASAAAAGRCQSAARRHCWTWALFLPSKQLPGLGHEEKQAWS